MNGRVNNFHINSSLTSFYLQKTYKTKVPYDPEGALGTLTSSFLVFLGVQVCLFFQPCRKEPSSNIAM